MERLELTVTGEELELVTAMLEVDGTCDLRGLIMRLDDEVRGLRSEADRLTSDKPEVRDTAALDKVRLRLDILTRCHTAAVRREATERLGRYAKEQPALDRTKQLEVAFGDVGALLVDALIKAEGGDWETVVAKVKAAAKRLSDGKNLAELMNDMALRSERGAQMSLPGV